jgi:dsDNA-specific endonuclease/ATPase MutS2
MVYLSQQDSDSNDLISYPIDGILDLHTFRPNEIHSLIPEYLNECRQKGIMRVRIIHGKGSGHLRKGVQDLLNKLPNVKKIMDAPPDEGGWGASIVYLQN